MSNPKIRVFPGHGESLHGPMKPTTVEFPFTEVTPSISPPHSHALHQCEAVLNNLSPHQRGVVLMLLCSKYGKVML